MDSSETDGNDENKRVWKPEAWELAQGDYLKLQLDFVKEHRHTANKSIWERLQEVHRDRFPSEKEHGPLENRVRKSHIKLVENVKGRGVTWPNFILVSELLADYFDLPYDTTFEKIADNHEARGFVNRPIRERDVDLAESPPDVLRDSNTPLHQGGRDLTTPTQATGIASHFVARALILACFALLALTAWLFHERDRLTSSIDGAIEQQLTLQQSLETTSRELQSTLKQRGRFESSVEQLSKSNELMAKENSQLRAIENPMQLIETLQFDKPPLAIPFISTYLNRYEPTIFYQGQDDLYDFARVVTDRGSLGRETNIVAEMEAATQTFDVFTNVGGVYKENLLIIEAGLKRGVKYRLILSDYRDDVERLDFFTRDIGEGGAQPAREVLAIFHEDLDALIEKISQDEQQAEYTGTLEIKWNRKSILYTMWLRDGHIDTGVAHLGLHLYSGKPNWPSFRISNQTANLLLRNLAKEFEFAWNASEEYESISLKK